MTREDVIGWLEYLSDDARSKADSLVPTNIEIACGMAIDALKAQEPRVMMLEEVKAFEWDYCYLEQERQPGKEYRMIVGDYVLTCITWPCIASMRIVHGDDSYGVKWRCWDKKPTDEQRENTPWMKN